MSGARQSYGHSAGTLSRAQARLERAERGEPIDLIARRDGTSRGAVFRDIRLAREETGPPREALRPRRRMSERAMLFRAWTATRYLNVFRILAPDLSRVWLEVVMEIHLNSDNGDLWFGPRCASLAELARGVRAAEADIEELISRDLLIPLEEGGIALPEDLGLRLPERVGGKAMGSGATPPQRRREPDGKQGEILMTMPGRPEAAGPGSKTESKTESANVESGGVRTQHSAAQIRPETLSQTQFSGLAGGKGTTTTTKESESLGGGGGGESVTAREAKPESAKPESAKTESAKPESANVESPPPHVALAAELLPLVGRAGTAAPAELNLVRSWLETRTANDIRAAIGTRMERKDAPPAPDLSYFDQRIRQWGPRVAYQPPPAAPPAPEPPEDPADTIALIHSHEPDNPDLVTAWTPLRATLKAGIGEAEYRSWVREMALGGLDGDEIVMLLPNPFARDWVRDHYGPRISTLWKAAYPEARRVDFRVRA